MLFIKNGEQELGEILAKDPLNRDLVYDVTGKDASKFEIYINADIIFKLKLTNPANSEDQKDYEITLTVRPHARNDLATKKLKIHVISGNISRL